MRVARNLYLAFAVAAALALPSPPGCVSASSTSPALDKAHAKGQRLMEKGRYDAAIKHLRKAEQLAESSVPLLLDLAACHVQVGEFKDAETYARRALERASDPADRAPAYNHLGISLFAQVESYFRSPHAPEVEFQEVMTEAESAFRKVLELTGGRSNPARYNLARALKLHGKDEEAQRAFAEFLERSPDGPQAVEARRALEWLACRQQIVDSQSEGGASAQDVVLLVGGDVKPPVKVHVRHPWYTEAARKARVQGTIVFEAIIDRNGDIRCLDLLRGLPMGLSETAAEAVRSWKFEPATLDGEPVPVRYSLTVNMSLPGG